MDALTATLASIFPGWAAKRVAARARLEAATRMYDAIKQSPYRPRRGGSASGDSVMDSAKGNLREYARWLDENHDLAIGVLDDLVSNIVGPGVGIEPTTCDSDGVLLVGINERLKELWRFFWERPEVTGELPGPELERLICRTWLRDGEVFIQHVTKDSAPYNTDIPYTLEPLEADFVPFDLNDENALLRHGVQKNAWGAAIGYWLHKRHPGNSSILIARQSDMKWIPAENMIHLKMTKRLHQTRGASLFHGVFTRLDDIKDYEESERIAARVAAALTAFVQKSADYSSPDIDPVTGQRHFEMAPGMVFDNLMPGETIGTIKSDRPNPSLTSFRDAQMRAVSAGTGAKYSSISRNYDGTYSAQRQEMVESSVHYRRLFSYLMFRFYLPIWRRFVDAARQSGELRLPRGIKESSLYYPEFRSPSLPWIDPLKEIKAFREAVDAGFKSRYQVIRDLGGDPQVVDSQIKGDPYSTIMNTPSTDSPSVVAPDDYDANAAAEESA